MKRIWIYKVVCDGGTEGYAMAEEVFGRVTGTLSLARIATELKRTIEYGLKSKLNVDPVAVIYKPIADDIIGIDGQMDPTIDRKPLSKEEIQEFRKLFSQKGLSKND